MATEHIKLTANTWTEIAETPKTIQGLGNRRYKFIEALTPPVGLSVPYRMGNPGQEYVFSPTLVGGKLYAFPTRLMGNTLAVSEGRNPRDVYIQDQTTPPFDLYFAQAQGAPTTLTIGTTIDDTTITVASVANIALGDYIGIFSGASGENRFYFGEVLGVSGLIVTLDTPLDFAFSAGDSVQSTTRDLNVAASRIAPQTFSVRGPGTGSPVSIDITRLLFSLITAAAGELQDFGDIAGGLLNGIVLRRNNGFITNIANIKTNRDLKNLAYDYTSFDAANPGQGEYGSATRYTFGGQDKHGVVIRLSANESLDLIIQDDLSSLSSFRIIGAGHQVEC